MKREITKAEFVEHLIDKLRDRGAELNEDNYLEQKLYEEIIESSEEIPEMLEALLR